jgi:hypothetical protein
MNYNQMVQRVVFDWHCKRNFQYLTREDVSDIIMGIVRIVDIVGDTVIITRERGDIPYPQVRSRDLLRT